MLYLDYAIKTRWDAKSLSSSITGGVWHGGVPEATALDLINNPYCIWIDVSDSTMLRSTYSRYQKCLVQFQVIALQDVTCGQLCELVEAAYLNANQAASNPLAMPVTPGVQDSILYSQLVSPYVIEDVGDSVCAGTMTFEIEYGRLAGLRPS